MSTARTQVRITNITIRKDGGSFAPKILSIKASVLPAYIKGLLEEANKVYTPERSKKFESLPLLSVWDLADTQEEVIFNTYEDLPTKTVVNSKGAPILIIIPADRAEAIGTNKYKYLKKKEKDALGLSVEERKASKLSQ